MTQNYMTYMMIENISKHCQNEMGQKLRDGTMSREKGEGIYFYRNVSITSQFCVPEKKIKEKKGHPHTRTGSRIDDLLGVHKCSYHYKFVYFFIVNKNFLFNIPV